MRCQDCFHDNFVELEGDYLCRYCGLVAISHYSLVDTYDTLNHSEELIGCQKEVQSTKNEKHILDILEQPLNLNETIVNNAKEILKNVTYKGDSRRNAFIAAAIHYSSNKSVQEIAEDTGISVKDIYKASTSIFNTHLSTGNELVNKTNGSEKYIAILHRLIQKLFFLPKEQENSLKQNVRKKIFKYLDQPLLKPYVEDKIVSTFIYIACQELNIVDGNINNICLACKIAKATIKRIETSIHKCV